MNTSRLRAGSSSVERAFNAARMSATRGSAITDLKVLRVVRNRLRPHAGLVNGLGYGRLAHQFGVPQNLFQGRPGHRPKGLARRHSVVRVGVLKWRGPPDRPAPGRSRGRPWRPPRYRPGKASASRVARSNSAPGAPSFSSSSNTSTGAQRPPEWTVPESRAASMRLSGVRISTARRSTVTVKTAASRVPGLRTSRAGVRRAAARSGLGPAAGLVHSPRPSLPSAAGARLHRLHPAAALLSHPQREACPAEFARRGVKVDRLEGLGRLRPVPARARPGPLAPAPPPGEISIPPRGARRPSQSGFQSAAPLANRRGAPAFQPRRDITALPRSATPQAAPGTRRRRRRVDAVGDDLDRRAGSRRQHHQAP